MTIEEIKEWREQGIAGADYNKGELFEIIDTLLAEVAHLDADLDRVEVIANTQRHQLAVATEALEKIKATEKDDWVATQIISSAALERMRG